MNSISNVELSEREPEQADVVSAVMDRFESDVSLESITAAVM